MASNSIVSEIERIMQSIKETTIILRAEYRTKRLAQQKKKHQNEKTRSQYKKRKQTMQSMIQQVTQQATQPATQLATHQKQKSE